MDLGLVDKVFLVAASSKGLGFGVADRLAAEGARVSLASRTAEDIEAAAHSIEERHGVKTRGYSLDLVDADSIAAWVTSTQEEFGGIDGLVVNAGGPPPGTFDTFNDDDWQKAYELTLMSSVRMIRGVLPMMRMQQKGTIVTITSISVKEPIDQLLLSNVFRSGVTSLVKSLSRDLAREGIRINNLVPGRMDTDRVRVLDDLAAEKDGLSPAEVRAVESGAIPLGRYGTIEEFGNVAAFLLSDAASYINGATLLVDGGLTRTVW